MGEYATAFIRLEREGDGFVSSDDPLEGSVQRNLRTLVTESNQDA